MRSLVLLVAAATLCFGGPRALADGEIQLAQAVTTPPTVTPSPTPSTPVTSTVTNCMMSCNSVAANCQSSCLVPAPPGATPAGAGTLNAGASTTCSLGCSSNQLACQTSCARLSPSQ